MKTRRIAALLVAVILLIPSTLAIAEAGESTIVAPGEVSFCSSLASALHVAPNTPKKLNGELNSLIDTAVALDVNIDEADMKLIGQIKNYIFENSNYISVSDKRI